jgi:hypothetical protein
MDESHISACLELFDLPDAFTEAQLKQAYHDLVQVWHPDKHSHNARLQRKADEKMKEINQAYEVLKSGLVNGSFRLNRSKGWPGTPTPRKGPGSGHPPPPTTHTGAAESAPQEPPAPAAPSPEPKWVSGNALWIMLIGFILLVVIVAPRGRKVDAPEILEAAGPPSDADWPLLFAIEGPQTGTNPTPGTISKAVDSKYGFKDLKFGMSIEEARRRLRPDRITTNQYNQLVTFWYEASASNKLGDFPLDYVHASFFHGQLFKIEVAFSSNQVQLFDTLRAQFGPSCPNDSLTRGGAPLRAECWFGEKAFCAIVAPRDSERRTGWDAMVMYDQALNRAAQQYATEEPIRAAQALSEAGFGEFKFGMTLKEFTRKLRRSPGISDAGVGQREAVVSGSEDARLGRYPLSSLTASFFQDKLFRLELDFDTHSKEMYEGFMNRFPTAMDSDSWGRSGEGLRAKQFASPRTVAVILAPRRGTSQWDSIVLCDRQMDEQRREFERDAPTRAAKDL